MTQTSRFDDPPALPQEPITALEQAGGVLSLLAVFGLAGVAGMLRRRKPVWLALAGASFSALAGIFFIYRNPKRTTPSGSGQVVAPCDGEVISTAQVHEPRFLGGPACAIAIRVRPGDVQMICAPSTGVVRYRRQELRGQAGETDDCLWLGIREPEGARVLVKLSASRFWRLVPGFVGRRVTTQLDLEDGAAQGQIFGHLPLGGEVRIFVPATAHVMLKPHMRTRARETVIAQL